MLQHDDLGYFWSWPPFTHKWISTMSPLAVCSLILRLFGCIKVRRRWHNSHGLSWRLMEHQQNDKPQVNEVGWTEWLNHIFCRCGGGEDLIFPGFETNKNHQQEPKLNQPARQPAYLNQAINQLSNQPTKPPNPSPPGDSQGIGAFVRGRGRCRPGGSFGWPRQLGSGRSLLERAMDLGIPQGWATTMGPSTMGSGEVRVDSGGS